MPSYQSNYDGWPCNEGHVFPTKATLMVALPLFQVVVSLLSIKLQFHPRSRSVRCCLQGPFIPSQLYHKMAQGELCWCQRSICPCYHHWREGKLPHLPLPSQWIQPCLLSSWPTIHPCISCYLKNAKARGQTPMEQERKWHAWSLGHHVPSSLCIKCLLWTMEHG